MAIINTVSIDFDTCSSIVKGVFDCRLSGVFYAFTDMLQDTSFPCTC